MVVSFEITMPNVGSWNGKWTGEKDAHFKFVALSKKEADKIIKEGPYHYNFGDGWSACVTPTFKKAPERNKIAKVNSGFMGYDWMIYSIIKHGTIKTKD